MQSRRGSRRNGTGGGGNLLAGAKLKEILDKLQSSPQGVLRTLEQEPDCHPQTLQQTFPIEGGKSMPTARTRMPKGTTVRLLGKAEGGRVRKRGTGMERQRTCEKAQGDKIARQQLSPLPGREKRHGGPHRGAAQAGGAFVESPYSKLQEAGIFFSEYPASRQGGIFIPWGVQLF